MYYVIRNAYVDKLSEWYNVIWTLYHDLIPGSITPGWLMDNGISRPDTMLHYVIQLT